VACGGDDAEPAAPGGGAAAPPAVRDATGATIKLDRAPQRIVCLWSGCDEILADLEMTPVATALGAKYEPYPIYFGAKAAKVEAIKDFKSVEEVAGWEPDLIVVRAGMEDVRDIMKVVAPVYLGYDVDAVSDISAQERYERNVRNLGRLVGRGAQADAAVARFRGVVERIKAALPPEAASTRFAIVFAADEKAYSLAMDGTPFCDLAKRHGLGTCAIKAKGGGEVYASVSPEAFLDADPEVIAFITYGDSEGRPNASVSAARPSSARMRAEPARMRRCAPRRVPRRAAGSAPGLGRHAPGPFLTRWPAVPGRSAGSSPDRPARRRGTPWRRRARARTGSHAGRSSTARPTHPRTPGPA
jgi:ABC-type Fe3+-hydroxamate transport system substrate-binding protein